MKKGFTLTEVVVVIGIILVLSAIGFSVSAPIRVKALEGKSASQMKTIYQGIMLYSADTGEDGSVPGVDNIPIGFGIWPYSIMPYGVRKEDFFSPVEPKSANPKEFTSYLLPVLGLTRASLRPKDYPFLAPELDRFKNMGLGYPMIIDANFDFHFYWPDERDSDPFMLRRHEIHLTIGGAILTKRLPGNRGQKAFKTTGN